MQSLSGLSPLLPDCLELECDSFYAQHMVMVLAYKDIQGLSAIFSELQMISEDDVKIPKRWQSHPSTVVFYCCCNKSLQT